MIRILKKKTLDAMRNDKALLEKTLNDMSSRFFNTGAHLNDEIFVPEYLGFDEFFDPENERVKRIYSKKCNEEVFSLVRSVNTDKEWIILRKGLPPLLVTIHSMLHAIIILDSIGFDVNVENYVSQGNKSVKRTDDGDMDVRSRNDNLPVLHEG